MCNKTTRYFSLIFILFLTFAAEASASINVKVWASEDGLTLKYNIPVVGFGNINLENEGDTETVKIRMMMVKLFHRIFSGIFQYLLVILVLNST